MCTMSIIPKEGKNLRIVFSRDELRTRPQALPPQLGRFGSGQAILPIDPVSGGTWIAVNESGLVLAVMNVNPPDRRSDPQRSRGRIIPEMLDAASPERIGQQIRDIPVGYYAPFRLIVMQDQKIQTLVWDGAKTIRTEPEVIERPMMYTSSGLGDHLVESPRRELFEKLVIEDELPDEGQLQFHRQYWPGKGHLSVMMSRCDASTVSITVVEVSQTEANMSYYPVAANEPGEAHLARILFRRGGDV
jgi:uncharacterized protein with NRDE domain